MYASAIDLYIVLKYVHVVLAIVAVGFNASYGVWLARAAREPAHLGHVLRGIKTLDDRFANPAYGLLLVTGLSMAFVGGIPLLQTRWLVSALVLYAVLLVVGIAVYSPTLRRQIALLDSSGPTSADYLAAASRGRLVGIVLAVIVLVIVLLMVTKPAV
jgi:uncharacterized membrane protein